MKRILTNLSTPAIVDALRENFYDTCWDLRDHWKHAVFEETEKQRRWWTSMPMAFIFNAAISLRPPAGDETEHIHETIGFFSPGDERRSVGGSLLGWKRVGGEINLKHMNLLSKLVHPAWQWI